MGNARRGGSGTRLPGCWHEVTVVVAAAAEEEAVALACGDESLGSSTSPHGPGRVRVTAWFTERPAAEAARARLAAAPGLGGVEAAVAVVRDPGWLEPALARREPVRAGRFAIADDAGDAPAGDGDAIVLAIPAGRAFGTGEHATTRLCLELLDRHLPEAPGAVLDLGTGSGILAIAAARAGAPRVVALDLDADALEVAAENAARNGVEARIRLARGSWTDLAEDARFSLLLANIHRTALVRAASRLAKALEPGGVAILSGFTTEDEDEVARAWRGAGADVVEPARRGEWSALACRVAPARREAT